MKTYVIVFFGNQTDQFGMPEPYYCYAILVSQYPNANDHFNVSVLSVSRGSPASSENQLVKSNNEAGALATAVAALKAHPAHRGLSVEEGALNH